MAIYSIEIQGNTAGELYYNVTFQSAESWTEQKKFNSAETCYIHDTVEHLAEALKALSAPQELDSICQPSEKHRIKAVREVLDEVILQLNCLNGLLVADAEAPDDRFSIDNTKLLARLNEADGILERLEHSYNVGCL